MERERLLIYHKDLVDVYNSLSFCRRKFLIRDLIILVEYQLFFSSNEKVTDKICILLDSEMPRIREFCLH